MAAGDKVSQNDLVVLGPFTCDGTGVTKGDVVVISSGTVTVATASLDGPYYVAGATYAASATDVKLIAAGRIWVASTGSITVGEMVSAAAAGDVAAYSAETISTTPTQADVQNVQNKQNRIVGRCIVTAASNLTLIKLGRDA